MLLRAGSAYFALVFALGFALGSVRTLWLAPRLGDTPAVALELPLMLAASWLSCRRIVLRFRVPDRPVPRLAMGGLALALLLGAEAGVAVLVLGRSLGEHLAGYRSGAARLGLAGQLLFALLPWIEGRRASRARA